MGLVLSRKLQRGVIWVTKMTSYHRRLFASLIDPPLDPTLVDNTPKLLDLLNKTDRLQKVLAKRDERGFTLLHIAAERNQPESLKCLLIKDGKKGRATKGQGTSKAKDEDKYKILLEKRPDGTVSAKLRAPVRSLLGRTFTLQRVCFTAVEILYIYIEREREEERDIGKWRERGRQ